MANLANSNNENWLLDEPAEITIGIFEGSPDCAKVLSLDGHLMAMNRHGQCAMEIDDFDCIRGALWHSFWPEATHVLISEALNAARSGSTGHFEAFCPTAKGHPRWWDVKVNLVKRSDGRGQALLAVSRDITSIHQANAELRRSAERFRSLAAATSAIVWTASASGEFETVEPSWNSFTGQTPQEARRWGWLQTIHPEDRERVKATWTQAVKRPVLYETEYRLRRADGQYRCMRVRAVPIVESGETIREWAGVHTDITHRKHAEDEERRATVVAVAAAEANAKYRTFFEQGPYFAGIMNLDGTVVEVNHLCLSACGFPSDEIIGNKFWECAWWNQSQTTVELIRAGCMQAASGVLFQHEVRYQTAEDSERYVDLVLAPVTDVNGQVLFVAVTGTDSTERKQGEKRQALLETLGEMTRSTAEPQVIMAEIPRLVGQYLRASRCVYADVEEDANAFAIRYEWTAMGITSSVGSYSLDTFGRRTAAEMHAGQTLVIRNVSAELTSSIGTRMFDAMGVQAVICCPLVKDGKLVAMMAVHQVVPRDWTFEEIALFEAFVERSWAHIERARADEALLEADRRKTEFLATLAHELRNPLAPIQNGLQVMRLAAAQPATVAKVRDMMERQLTHLVHLVNDLLDIARITNGKVDLQKARIELKAVVASAVETSLPLIEANRHDLVINLPDEVLMLDIDATRIAQVISNLLNNAAKYTPAGGQITISVRQESGDVVILVSDTGVGIPKQSLKTVFEMFTQVKRNMDRAQGGLGIGLSLVRRIVELHDGEVTVSSAGAGKGSTFGIRLPLSNQITETPHLCRPCIKSVSKDIAKQIRILVVDDNVDAGESMAALLTMQGYLTRVAHDGQQALQMAVDFQPKVIFLDIGMPGMNGYQVAQALRAVPETKTALLVALTGWGAREDRIKSQRAGFDEHLTKPADPAVVAAILSKCSQLSVTACVE